MYIIVAEVVIFVFARIEHASHDAFREFVILYFVQEYVLFLFSVS